MNSIKGHLYLTGYRGSGKSCVGRWLSETLELPSVDVDDRIEATAGMSIAEIFSSEGEQGFRDRETAALQQVSEAPACIISLGGGAIIREQNRKIIADSGFCVWLKADADTLMSRLKLDVKSSARRPALTSLSPLEEIRTLLHERAVYYAQAANAEIDVVGKSISHIGKEIIGLLASRSNIAQ